MPDNKNNQPINYRDYGVQNLMNKHTNVEGNEIGFWGLLDKPFTGTIKGKDVKDDEKLTGLTPSEATILKGLGLETLAVGAGIPIIKKTVGKKLGWDVL